MSRVVCGVAMGASFQKGVASSEEAHFYPEAIVGYVQQVVC